MHRGKRGGPVIELRRMSTFRGQREKKKPEKKDEVGVEWEEYILKEAQS